jgi:hypothetical protein
MPGRNVIIVAGVSGNGKSTFGLRYLVNADLSARFLFDPDPGEFNPDLGEFADRLGLPPARDLYGLSLSLVRGSVAFDPHALFPGRLREAFAFFCEWAWEKSLDIPGQKVLVVDEIWAYQTHQSIPFELQTIVQSGRKRGLQLMVNIQQPNRLNDTIINGASEVICFKLQGKSLETVERFGFKPEEVEALQPLEWIGRNVDTGGELRGRIKL